MTHRPLLLILSALLFLYFPGEFFLEASRGKVYSYMDIFLSVACPIGLLFGLINVSKVGWYTLVCLIALWGVRDLNAYYATRSTSFWPLLMHVGIYSISLGYFINPRVRHLYFDPKLRWWRTKRRYETHMPFLMRHGEDWHYPILRNISEGGCFIETSTALPMASVIDISIPLPSPLNVSVIKTRGEVRWVSRDPMRTGVGIQFVDSPEEQLLAIKDFTHHF